MLKRTALYEEHKKLNSRLVEFGGWEMPVQYSGVIDEHIACRSSAGLFDVSHMGEVTVQGPDAEAFLNYLVSNDVSKLSELQAQYSAMCNESGGIVDDLVIYRRSKDRFLVVVNASNTDKDFQHMQAVLSRFKNGRADLELQNKSSDFSQIAVQGPRAAEILQKLTHVDLNEIKTYWFKEGDLELGSKKVPAILARTGYTGEDGFEVYCAWESGPWVWSSLMDAGMPLGLKPCGLGARDTLRLEMKYPLYGNELSDQTHPLEAGLGWVVKLSKGDFVGRAPIVDAKEKGLRRKLVGLKLTDKGIPRHGYPVCTEDGSKQIGEVTSGTHSPSLNLPIGIAYVDVKFSEVGTTVTVDVRGRKLKAEIVPTPFYKRRST